MTNAELIDKIKAEIVRLMQNEITHNSNGVVTGEFRVNARQLMDFLDTLEEKSEKPINQEGLEEDLTNEADKMFFSLGFYEGDHHQPMLDAISQEQFRGLARHFAKWGAEHAKIDVTDFCKPIDPGIAQCIADHSWEMLGEEKSEKPMNLEKMEWEEELKKTVHQVSEEIVKEIFPDDLESGDFFTEIDLKNCITRVAYQFADWGAEHPKGSSKIPKDLEEYASRAGFDYVDNIVQEYPGHRFNDHDVEFAYRDGIIAGAKWQYQKDRAEFAKLKAKEWSDGYDEGITKGKELMMKEAVEGEIENASFGIVYLRKNLVNEGHSTGDKVRIIVLPKED